MWKSRKDKAKEKGKGSVPGMGDGTKWGTEMGGGMELEAGGGAGISLKGLRTFNSLKNPVFRLYYGAMLGQMAAMNMQLIVRSLLIYRLTGSAAILGVMALAHALPMLFFSAFGGVIADRVQKKYVLIVGQASSAAVSLGIALALSQGYMSVDKTGSWWILIVASVLQGTIMAFMMPSRQAIISEIVSEEQLMNAVALNTMGMNALRLTAPALAGLFIDAFGFASIYYTMTGLYLMAVVFVVPMPLTSTMAIKGQGALRSVKEGFQYVRHETIIFLLLGLTLFTVILSMPYMYLMPIFTDDILKVGATGMGVLFTVSGGGAIVGSLILASLPDKKRGAMLLVGIIILALALVSFSFSRSWYLSLTSMIFVGVGQTVLQTLAMTLLLYYAKEEYRGRVMSILIMQFGLNSLGTFFCGMLAETVGVQWSVGGFAMVLALLSILSLALVHRIRNLD